MSILKPNRSSVQAAQARFQALHKKSLEGAPYHPDMFQAASILHEYKVPAEVIVEHLYKASETVTARPPRPGEIEDIVRHVTNNHSIQAGERKAVSTVRKNQEQIDIWARKGDVNRLKAKSGKIPTSSEQIIRELFEENSLLHISPNWHSGIVKARDEWFDEGLDKMQFICPCEFKTAGATGRNKDNVVLPRRFIVFETDDLPADWDAQAGLIERLSQEAPLRLVVSSSNKSYHAWIDVSKSDDSTRQRVEDLAITLGSDAAVTNRPSQLCRFPWGLNTKTGLTQEVIFYSPVN